MIPLLFEVLRLFDVHCPNTAPLSKDSVK